MADDAGALLVRSGLVSAGALDDARARVEQTGGTLGEQLVVAGVISDEALTDFYRSRLLVPAVNPNLLARLPAKVVAVIPTDMAVELRAVPVSLDADNNLTVAMSDPSDRHAVDEIAFFTGTYVVRAVATQMQIAWCLAHYYGHVTPLGTRLMQSTDGVTAPTASPPQPRTRGHTAKVNATRHRALAPVTSQVQVQRPSSAPLDDPRPGPVVPETKTLVPPAGDAIPEIPRARTASGEIRLPRAASVKPPPPEEASGPIITIEVAEEATGPRMAVPKRRAPARTDPPELAARAGEVSIRTSPIRLVELDGPTVVIAEDVETPTTVIARPADVDAPVIIHSQFERESQPILLQRKRPSDPPASAQRATLVPDTDEHEAVDDDELEEQGEAGDEAEAGESDIVVLDSPKSRRRPRPEKRTQIGMGAVTAVTRTHRDTEADGMPAIVDDAPTSQMAAAQLPAPAPPPEPAPAPAPRITAIGIAPPPIPQRQVDYDSVDEGWGAPGTTIPPPLLGAMPGVDEPEAGGVIPIANVDSAPLVVAEAKPAVDADAGNASLVRELEDATARAIELIRRLDAAHDRDEVVGIMVEHLASSHRRAGFFSIRPVSPSAGASLTGVARGATEIALFSLTPTPASIPTATLRLDRPSTLQDVVGTRLPYRGPMVDEASRQFLAQVLGACPPEILLVPVTVRERVVGVLFGEHRTRATFDDQLALAARAAGVSLERILAKKKPTIPG